jgi:hypothetical protein
MEYRYRMKSVVIPLLLSSKLYPTYHIKTYNVDADPWQYPSAAALVVSVRVSS